MYTLHCNYYIKQNEKGRTKIPDHTTPLPWYLALCPVYFKTRCMVVVRVAARRLSGAAMLSDPEQTPKLLVGGDSSSDKRPLVGFGNTIQVRSCRVPYYCRQRIQMGGTFSYLIL
jgi:hypothetical protein